jgi:hypothetical protein
MVIATHVLLRIKNHATKVSEAETSVFKETFKSMKAFVKANVEQKENCLLERITKISPALFKMQEVQVLLLQVDAFHAHD